MIDFIDRIKQLSLQAEQNLSQIQTEEATKNALIMPFIQLLGYDVFNLNEVNPELTADIGVKKGEKVDYAIMKDGYPIILFECKTAGTDLSDVHASQLYRYFSATDARFAVLTNGIEYWFYTDLDAPNKMDKKPFLVFNLLDVRDRVVEELKKFAKDAFDIDEILSTANQLKYTNEIKRILISQMSEPDDEFVRFFAGQVYPGRLTPTVREEFALLTRQALRQFVRDQVTERLKSALAGEIDEPLIEETDEQGSKVETTIEEHEGYLVVRAIMREVVDVQRVVMRDTQSYCGILLDDNNRKPICRLHFNTSQKYLGLFDAEKNEERVPIQSIDEIYQYSDQLKATASFYHWE